MCKHSSFSLSLFPGTWDASAVVFIGKGGYWEGRAGGRQGWFPAKAIKDVEDEDSGVYVEPGK